MLPSVSLNSSPMHFSNIVFCILSSYWRGASSSGNIGREGGNEVPRPKALVDVPLCFVDA